MTVRELKQECFVLIVVTGSDRADHCRVTFQEFKTRTAANEALTTLRTLAQSGANVKATLIEDF